MRTHVDRIKKSWDEIFEYFEGIIVKREADPQNDLISSLIEAETTAANSTGKSSCSRFCFCSLPETKRPGT